MTVPVVDDLFDLLQSMLGGNIAKSKAHDALLNSRSKEDLKKVFDALPDELRKDPTIIASAEAMAKWKVDVAGDAEDPIKATIKNLLTTWQNKISAYDLKDPAKAKDTLADLSAYVIELAAGAFALELALGILPNTEGTVASAKVQQLMGWLGFGAVVTAVAHDPVKIGLLRPYQDTLEATFRNRRPDDFALFQAYKTRELTATKADDLSKLDDTLMDTIEKENQTIYDREIAKWGYSVDFAGALARSATRTLNFSHLSALARQGLLTRGLAIYSLWGEGLDRTVMKPALDALMQQNRIANYEGFRGQIEPGYVEGYVSEEDLKAYWAKINVPSDVQAFMLPRMKARRAAYATKLAEGAQAKERDLTVSQVQQAYENELIRGGEASNMLLDLGYSQSEVAILMTIAEKRRKVPAASKLKRLPLSDYEKAHKNKLISKDDVLARMRGEYTPEDIALEEKLLQKGVA